MGTYLYFDNSELWEHIQSELWHLSFGIMGSFLKMGRVSIAQFSTKLLWKALSLDLGDILNTNGSPVMTLFDSERY
jgi:hypothetical protein